MKVPVKQDDEGSETKPDDEKSEGEWTPLSPRRAPTQAQMGPSEATNLVSLLAKIDQGEYLKKMAAQVLDDYDADVKSRSKRMKKLKRFQELFGGILKAKTFPFQNAANVNLPFLQYPVLQDHARLYDVVIPSNGKIMYCSPLTLDDEKRSHDAEMFCNAYIRYKIDNYATGMDSSLLRMDLNGSAFRRTYWNLATNRVACDSIPIEDFVVAYWQHSDDPSMRDVPRYTMVQRLTIFDLEDYAAQGLYENVDKLKAEDTDSDTKRHDDGFTDTIDKEDGKEKEHNSSPESKARMVLEQHCKWRMPNNPSLHPSFDGTAHALIVTVDEHSQEILRVVIREEDDPADVPRYQKEMGLLQQHQDEMDAHEQAIQAHSDASAIAQNQGVPFDEPAPVAPSPPPGLKTDESGTIVPPKKPRQREITFFTHYKCSEGEGFYGHGFGDWLAPLAEAANTILNQHIDGVTLTNARPGFISRQLRGAEGSLTVQPGVLQTVDAPSGSIKDAIAWLEVPPSDPTTMPLIELLQEMTEKFGGNDTISGEQSKSNQTARGTMILNEQAMAPISVRAKRVKEAQKHELDKIWRCLGVFLPDDTESMTVLDEFGNPQQISVSRDMFHPDMHVMPVSDVRMKTQRADETMQNLQMAMQNPIVNQSRPAMQKLTEDWLRARDAEQIIPLIQPPPPQPPPPPVPAYQENAGFLRGQDHQVHPLDDDTAHIQDHTKFMGGSESGALLDPTQRTMLEQHIRNHAAQRLEKAGNGLQRQLGAVLAGSGAGGPPGMGGPPGNGPVQGMAGEPAGLPPS